MRALKITALAVAASIAIAAVLLLVVGIPSSFITSTIQTRVERDTGYRVKVAGGVRIGLWPSFNIIVPDVTVEDPNDRDMTERLTIGIVEAEMPLRDLLSGKLHITDLKMTRPVIRVPLLRDRTRTSSTAAKSTTPTDTAPTETTPASVTIDRVTLIDGAIIFSNPHDRVENRINAIGAVATIAGDRRVHATGTARISDKLLTFEIKATAPAAPLDRQTIPVDLSLDAPDLLLQRLTATADVRLNGSVLMINSLGGSLGDEQFNGWASADLASKPLVKLDLDFQKLVIGTPSRQAAPGLQGSSSTSPEASQEKGSQRKVWSDEAIDLSALNYADAQVRISAAKLEVGDARFANAAIDATLSAGVLRASFAKLGVYGGEAEGEFAADVTGSTPAFLLHTDLSGVRALPLLSGLADFDKLDGRMQAKISVRSAGSSQRAIMSGLIGTAFVSFQDGAIRGINVARMIRSLTTNPLSGWQEGSETSTDLTQLGASFRIERGQATTNDLALLGPLVRMTGAGTVDLGAKSLALRVEPKLVMSLQGQGSTTAGEPVGLGIPVVIQGPWAAPQFYPDMAGMLDNPDAAYAKLRDMGKGLFGDGTGPRNGNSQGGGNTANPLGGQLGDTLGSLIQQGIGAAMSNRGVPPPATSSTPTTPTAPETQAAPADDDKNPMNTIMKQLFGR